MRKMALPALVSLVFLSACSTSGPFNTMPRKTDEEIRQVGKTQLEVSVGASKERLNGWHRVLAETYERKETWKVATNELFFYGTVIFSLASAQLLNDGSNAWKRARNIGGGTAFGADLLAGHYKFEIQEIAFRNARDRARCGAFAMANIRPDDERMALLSTAEIAVIDGKLRATDASHPGFIAVYNRIPTAANEFVEKVVLGKLANDLKSASPTKPTVSEITAAMDKWKKDQTEAGQAQSVLPSAQDALNPAKTPNPPLVFKKDRSDVENGLLSSEIQTMTPLQAAMAREALVTTVLTFESQLRLCDFAN